MTVMSISQVWITTPVDYLTVDEGKRDSLIDTLLGTEGVVEVCHYSDIVILCNLESDSDAEAVMEIAAIRSRIQTVFESFHVWPKQLKSVFPKQ